MTRSVAACLAVLLALFEVGSCVRCYQCNSQNDKNCVDPFKGKSKLIDCATQDSITYNQQFLYNILPNEVFGSVVGSPRYCHKIVMESGTIIRTCLDANPSDGNQTCRVMLRNSQSATTDKRIKSCDVCDKDSCNGAGALSVSLPLAGLALVASYLIYKH